MSTHHNIVRIVSSGQTGAERGGLDAAIEAGVWHGGWCPKDRNAEDGVIPAGYRLVELDSASDDAPMEANIIDSHCTVIFTQGEPRACSTRVIECAEKYQRLCLRIDLATMTNAQAAHAVLSWLSPGGVMFDGMPTSQPNPVMNVIGSRESEAPGIQQRVRNVMRMALKPPFFVPGAE